jgi:6-phosphogluconolactonase
VNDVEIQVLDDTAPAAAELLAHAARRGGHVALAGGSTVGPVFDRAAQLATDWSAAEVWWGDDRAVPADHDLSNYRLARERLLDRLETGPRAVHRIEGELGAEEAASRYDTALAGVTLDLALNGIGPDGHTASLFPNGPELEERERRAVAAQAGMEPRVPRVTMTIPVFGEAKLLLYVISGEDKAQTVLRAFTGEPGPDTPASLVRGRHTIALLDRAAASLLPSARFSDS